MEDKMCSSHPSTSHIEESVSVVHNVIRGDRRTRIREVAAHVGLYYGTCHMLLTQGLGMKSLQKHSPNGSKMSAKRNMYTHHISCSPLTVFSEFGPPSLISGPLTYNTLVGRRFQ
jgi:hypothetical protein